MTINWGKYGIYALKLTDPTTRAFSGHLQTNTESWRKMALKRPFTVAEEMLMDSEWEPSHPGGSFNIEFRADGYNHFICKDFPAHSHWAMVDDASATPTVHINWGKYGEYELKIEADGKSMSGSAKGQPDNWRKAKWLQAL